MRYADGPTAEMSTFISATPSQVWRWCTDIELPAELSDELQHVEWLDDGDAVVVGRRFAGRNEHPAMGRWQTVCTVVAATVDEEFAWAVGDPADPAATWRFRLQVKDDGCELSQCVRIGPGASGLSIAIEKMPDKEERIVERRLSEFRAGIERNLAEIKKRSERR